ncbi:Rha family transcriptional regulator [Limosilactobacillus balticus]|uniref:Rha family transcriptional regulator n=1 Tax=Limosilactobacillus balticus TaxID=2759747 RepID=UPI003991D0FF
MHGLNEEPYTTDKIIADCSSNSLHAVRQLIRTNKKRLEEFGILAFEMRKLKGRGRPEKIYHLTEQQATLLITFLDNTSKVIEFKVTLVREFYRMRKELNQRQINRAIEKPQRKSLTDAIKEWPQAPDYIYINMTRLLLKRATGLTAQQIKKQRHVKVALDGLTLKEQERYKQLENIAIGLVGLNKTWDEVKGVLLLA